MLAGEARRRPRTSRASATAAVGFDGKFSQRVFVRSQTPVPPRGPGGTLSRPASAARPGVATGEPRRHAVHRVAGVGDQRLVPGIEVRERDVPDALLRADQRDHLGLGIELDAEPPPVPVGDRPAELGRADVARVPVRRRVARPPRASPRRRARASGGPDRPRRARSRRRPPRAWRRACGRASANRYGGSVSIRLATLTRRPRARRATRRRSWPRRRAPAGRSRCTWSSARSTMTVPPGKRTSARSPGRARPRSRRRARRTRPCRRPSSRPSRAPRRGADGAVVDRRRTPRSSSRGSGRRARSEGRAIGTSTSAGSSLDEQHEVRVAHRDGGRLEGPAVDLERLGEERLAGGTGHRDLRRARTRAGPIPTVTGSTTPSADVEREVLRAVARTDAELRRRRVAALEHELAEAADPVAAHLGERAVRVAVVHEEVRRRRPPRVTRITPSAPTPECRSQSGGDERLRQRPGVLEVLEHDEVVPGAVVLPDPELSHRSPTRQVRRQVLDERRRAVRSRLEPADPRVSPEPRELPARERLRALHGRRDRLLEGSSPARCRANSAYPMAWLEVSQPPKPARDEPSDLVEPARVEHASDPRVSMRSRGPSRGIAMPDGPHARRAGYRSHAPGEARERPAGELGHLERPDRPPDVGRLDLRGRGRVELGEARVQPRSPRPTAASRFELAARVRVGRAGTRGRRRPPGSTAPSRRRAGRAARGRGSRRSPRARAPGNARDGERLGRLGDVDQVVRDRERAARGSASPSRRPSPGRRASSRPRRSRRRAVPRLRAPASVLPEAVGPTSARSGGAAPDPSRRGHQPTAAGSRTGSPSRWCGWRPTIRASRNVPGAMRRRRGARPGSSASGPATPPLRPVPLDEHLDGRADLLAHPLERDRLLERDQPVEPLLDDVLRELVRPSSAARVPGRGEYWNV